MATVGIMAAACVDREATNKPIVTGNHLIGGQRRIQEYTCKHVLVFVASRATNLFPTECITMSSLDRKLLQRALQTRDTKLGQNELL